MTTTDHAVVAPAVTGDPGTRADAGGFDPGRPPFKTKSGHRVAVRVPFSAGFGGMYGSVLGELHSWSEDGTIEGCCYESYDLVNVNAAPDPIPQPEGDAPPAPAQSAGAAADGEDDAALANASGDEFVLSVLAQSSLGTITRTEKAALRRFLARRGARPHELADASARSARGEVAEAVLAERAKGVLTWLDGALQCKSWRWDADQRECAQMEADALREILARPIPAAVLDRARLAGQGEGNGWLPIATAPKDGSAFLVFGDIGCRLGYFTTWFDNIAVEEREGYRDPDSLEVLRPTHWRPLPAPPSAAAAPPAPASRATSAPAQDAGPAGVTEAEVEAAYQSWLNERHGLDHREAWQRILEAAARARTPDAGKETGR